MVKRPSACDAHAAYCTRYFAVVAKAVTLVPIDSSELFDVTRVAP